MSATALLTLEQGIAHLGAIVGPEHVSIRNEVSRIMAAPADARQIAEVLRFANANGLTVMATGGSTKSRWGNPVAPDIELSLKRMCELREHTWQDMTCTVEAGCAWAAMQAELRRHGQMVALDPLWPERATVGGVVAANDSGALRLKYGGLRDLIIGMTIVLADGTIAKSGGKVVKNVAGYDIHKLLTGSIGTLGVIAEVNFRLHPLEEHARTWSVSSADCASFYEPLRALMDSEIVPTSVQMRVSTAECAVDIRVAGPPECLDECGTRIQTIFGGLIVNIDTEDVWAARQSLFKSSDSLVLKVSVLPADVCAVSAELRKWCAVTGTDTHIVGQATGLMTVGLAAASVSAMALVAQLRARIAPSGSVVVLQAPDRLGGIIDAWGPGSGTLPLMREIKRRLDPRCTLNPGRFVGNI